MINLIFQMILNILISDLTNGLKTAQFIKDKCLMDSNMEEESSPEKMDQCMRVIGCNITFIFNNYL